MNAKGRPEQQYLPALSGHRVPRCSGVPCQEFHEGRPFSEDNPLLLANRKAKKLKSLLLYQSALRHMRTPFIEAAVFLSAPGFHCDLSGAARSGVYLRLDSEQAGHPDILAVLHGAAETMSRGHAVPLQSLDRRLSQAIARALDQAGIRPSQRSRRVGDYQLEQLLGETDAYQDWQASHIRFPEVKRRVRLYPHALHASEAIRTVHRQAAEREFLLLEGLNHAGILKAEAFIEHERGPALIFEHDPAAASPRFLPAPARRSARYRHAPGIGAADR
jgi:hypothetical protein